MSKLFLTSAGIVTLAMVLIIYFAYFYLFPPQIIEMITPVKVVDETAILPGDTVNLELNYCKHRSLTSDIEIVLTNSVVLPSYKVITNLPVGCHVKDFEVILPIVARPGTYRAAVKFTYDSQPPFRGQQYIFFSEPFNVVSLGVR